MARRSWFLTAQTTVVLAPVVVVAGILVAHTNVPWLEPYWLDVSSKATGGFIVLAPASAALSAWDASRWRALSTLSVRGPVQLLAWQLALVGAVTVLTFAGSMVVMLAANMPPSGSPHWGVLAVSGLMVLACAAVGFVAGHFLPRVVAAPLALAVVWMWVAYTPAVQPFWMRNTTGNFAASCCTLDTELAPHALAAPGVLGAALLLASVLVLRSRRPAVWSTAVVAVVAAAVVLAASWTIDLGPDPVRARDGGRDCLRRDGTTLCAWPEHARRLADGADSLAAGAARLRAAGLDVPSTLRENAPAAHQGWTFSLSGDGVHTWISTLASSPLAALPPPCIDHNGGHWPAGALQPLASAWLRSVAGATPAAQGDLDAVDRRALDRLRRLSDREQLSWFRATRAALDGCGPLP